MPKVLNRRQHGRLIEFSENMVYVGRPTKWGNPFKLPSYYGNQSRETRLALRETLIRQYCEYLDAHPFLKEMARRELKGKDLVCWCAPMPCHADVLLELANA